jgi:hypothetical protein
MAIQTTDVLASQTTVYTSSNDTALTFLSICNVGVANITCNVHIVPNGDVPSDSNLFIKDLEIIIGDTYVVYQGGEKILMSNGDYVSIIASAATVTSIVSYTDI